MPTDFVQRAIHGALVDNADAAIAIAETLVRNKFGEAALREQQPLGARDGGQIWIVEGSLNRNRAHEGPGMLILRMN